MQTDPVRETRVNELLDQMLKADKELYEAILDSKLAFPFNELIKLAQRPDVTIWK